MSKWSSLGQQAASDATAKEDRIRRIAYSTYGLRSACQVIAQEYNSNVDREALRIEVTESTFSGFQVLRTDKKLRALICTRPECIEIQYIAGYKFDATEHSVGSEKYTVSNDGIVVFSTISNSLTPEALADKCCERVVKCDSGH